LIEELPTSFWELLDETIVGVENVVENETIKGS